MKKIFGLMVAALLVMMMVGGGTWAYFSDTETSYDNSLTAGTLDLQYNGVSQSGVATFTGTNQAPGDSGNGNKEVSNVGSLQGELDVAFSAITNTESTGGTEFENDSINGPGVGELGSYMLIASWLDYENGGSWSASDVGLKSNQSTYSYSAPTTGTATGGSTTTVVNTGAGWTTNQFQGLPVTVTAKGTAVILSNTADTLTVATPFSSAVANGDSYSIASGPVYDLVNSYGSRTWNAAVASVSAQNTAGANYKFNIDWVIPTSTGNSIQGDSINFDITFTLEQAEAD